MAPLPVAKVVARQSVTKRMSGALGAAYRNWTGAEGLTTPRQPIIPTVSQGRSATPSYGGFVVGRETNNKLIGTQKYVTYDQMLLNTSIVAASVRYYLNMVARPGWSFDPVNDTDEAKKFAELTEVALRSQLQTPWHSVIKKAATYRLYGFSAQEWVMKKDWDLGFFVMDDIQNRVQRTITRWDVDQLGRVKGIVQTSPHDGQEYYTPRGKLAYVVDDAFDDSPEGLGLFRQAVTACQYLSRFQQLEGWGYETDLKGMPIIKAPLSYLREQVENGDMEEEEAEEILAPLKEILEKHVRTPELGAMLDSMVYYSKGDIEQPSPTPMYSFSTVTGDSSKNGQTAVGLAIERLNWDIARVFGTETLLLGANGRGANALSKDKTQNLLMVVDGVLADITALVDKDFITPIFQINNWPLKLKPKVVTDAVTYRDIDDLTGSLLNLAKAGAVLDPNDPCINVLRRAVGLPRAPEVNRAAEAELALTQAQVRATENPPVPTGGFGASDDQKKE